MEVVTGPLPSVITKLGTLIAGEYNLQKGLKGEIRFLKGELESMQVAVEKVSNTLPDQLDKQDKIWARDLRELSYDIEDKIDTFMVRIKGNDPAELNGVKKFIGRSVKLFSKFRIRHGLGTEIRDTKMRLDEVSRRFQNLKIHNDFCKPIPIDDPRVFSQYKHVRELVGIHEAKEEVIKILMEGNEVSKQQNKIVSIVGFGGLGKTTIAYAVSKEIKTQFHCSAFVSVSQTPDTENLLKEMLKQLGKTSDATSIHIIVKELTEFLQKKRYLIVLDDIWCLSFWNNINSALPDNGFGNRIIITTRSVDVAEEAGGAYKLKPLSLNNSRKLLYGRVFGNESNEDTAKCPDMELAEVSNKILKKCAGVPLAIITMASLLARKGRDKLKWYEVYNLVGTGLEKKNPHVDNMRKILSFSYYDMPSHLRTCLLYLSMFPEDSRIGKSHLILLWISEGFIQGSKPGESLIELGESYFNELINRSMIQPEYDDIDNSELYCHVHDMVLDLLRTLSSEENFVTILNDVVVLSLPEKVRRLSLQNSAMKNHAACQVATMSMKQVRSVAVFGSPFEVILQAFSRFRIIRVLDLEYCHYCPEYSSLKFLGNLVHLRYLGLGFGPLIPGEDLPEEIGKLGFLQTLVLRGGGCSLPSSIVVQLKHLICIRVSSAEVVNGNGIGKLTCLEELSGIYTNSIDIIKEIGNLTELRVLEICYTDEGLDKSFVECLCKLQKLQSLIINSICHTGLILDGWVAPQHLRILKLYPGGFSTLPAWMNPSFLQHLRYLATYVKELRQEDFEILGKLPALRSLVLGLGHERAGLPRRFTAAAGSFPCLVIFRLWGYVQPLEVQQGAMSRLETLSFSFKFLWPEMMQIAGTSGGFDFGMRNLSSLKLVTAGYSSGGHWKEAEDVLRHELETHPNQPSYETFYHSD